MFSDKTKHLGIVLCRKWVSKRLTTCQQREEKVVQPSLFMQLPCSSQGFLWVLWFPLSAQKPARQLKMENLVCVWMACRPCEALVTWLTSSWVYSCLVFRLLEKFQRPPPTILYNNTWYLVVDGWRNACVCLVFMFIPLGLTIMCAVGPLPMVSKGTHVTIIVDSLKDKHWEAEIAEQSGNKVKLSINSPASAVCGLYGLTVTCGSIKGETTATHKSSKNIIMLFNPWCEGELGR